MMEAILCKIQAIELWNAVRLNTEKNNAEEMDSNINAGGGLRDGEGGVCDHRSCR